MSAVSSRPPIPRPTSRPTSQPPSQAAPVSRVSPAADSVRDLPRAYVSSPPEIRDRLATLDLEDGDIVEAAAAPSRPASAPPPAPRSTRTSVPPPAPVVKVAPRLAPLPAPVPVFSEPKAVAPVPSPPESAAVPSPPDAVAAVPSPPESAAVPRGSVPDPTDILFDGMYEIEFAETAWQAAQLCASSLARALGARSVVIHAHDLVRRELRTIAAHGAGASELLGSAEPSDDDLVGSAVICNERSVTMRFDGDLPRLAPTRFKVMGAPRTLVAVPAIAWGRCLAVIEVVDADERFAERVSDSAAYVAERLAAFLSRRAAA
jgi:hypothetical protein